MGNSTKSKRRPEGLKKREYKDFVFEGFLDNYGSAFSPICYKVYHKDPTVQIADKILPDFNACVAWVDAFLAGVEYGVNAPKDDLRVLNVVIKEGV